MAVQKRLEYIDLIKALAILAIVTLHVFQVWDMGPQIKGIPIFVFSELTRFGVPIFIMVSGALLLNREIEIKSFLKKRVSRIVYPFLFYYIVCVIFVALTTWTNSQTDSIFSFRWYFWMMLGVYLAAPIINKFIQHATEKEIEYFIAVFIFAAIFYQLMQYFGIENYFDLGFFLSPIGYFVLGYYLSRKDFKMGPNKLLAISILIFLIATFIKSCSVLELIPPVSDYGATNSTMLSSWLDVGIFQILQTAAMFLICKNIYECEDGVCLSVKRFLKADAVEKCIVSVSRSSYGMYLINMIPTLTMHHTIKMMHFTGTQVCISIIVLSIGIFLSTWFVVALLGRIPYIKYVSGYY